MCLICRVEGVVEELGRFKDHLIMWWVVLNTCGENEYLGTRDFVPFI